MTIRVHASRHSGADIDLTVSGYCEGGQEVTAVILAPKDYDECVTVRVMNVFRAIQNGLVAWLEWEGTDDVIMPLEGYGNTDLVKFNGLVNPRSEGWTGGLRLRVLSKLTAETGHFTISLELSKMRT